MSPIIPIFIRDNHLTLKIAKMLMHEGVFVNPIVSPAVSNTSALLRISIMSTHTYKQIDFLIDKLTYLFKELGVSLFKPANS